MANPDHALPLEAITFTFSYSNSVSYDIDFDDNLTSRTGQPLGGSGTESTNYAYALPGTYTVVVTVHGTNGGTDSTFVVVNVP